MQGLVWELKPTQIIRVEPHAEWEVICGLDMGFRDHTSLIVVLTDGHNYYVVDEYFAKGKTTSAHAEKIKELVDKWHDT
jgi:hypothetical protein